MEITNYEGAEVISSDFLAELEKLTINELSRWIRRYLQNLPVSPPYELDRKEPDLRLIALYRSMVTDRPELADSFERALARALEVTQPRVENSEMLYHILLVMSYVSSEAAREALRSQLLSRNLEGVVLEGVGDLQSWALNVYGTTYEIDRTIVSFVERTRETAPNFQYLLASFTTLARSSPERALAFLTQILHKHLPKVEIFQIGTHLEEFAHDYGYEELFYWLLSLDTESTVTRQNLTDLQGALREELPSKGERLGAFAEEWEFLFLTLLHRSGEEISADLYTSIADCEKKVGEPAITSLLKRLFESSRQPRAAIKPDRFPMRINNEFAGTLIDGCFIPASRVRPGLLDRADPVVLRAEKRLRQLRSARKEDQSVVI